MFGTKEKGIIMETPTRSAQVNMIGEGTTIRGSVDADGDLRIAGLVHGSVRCKGKVIVAKGGKVEGDIYADEADVAGTVMGQLHLGKRLSLRNGCEVDGDIFVKSLSIEDGALFEGRCVMREATASVSHITQKSNESKTVTA
jgi:cytoskeletal protein CcmA (bactofilin family)